MSKRFVSDLVTISLSILLGGCSLGPLMIHEQRSPYNFEATVSTVVNNAKARGWEVPKTFDFRAALVARGKPDPGPMTVIKLCSPELASRMFASDDSKFASVMAPCSISVYEKADGHTYIATMNMGLMAKIMGNKVGPVLADIAEEDAAIVAFAAEGEATRALAGR